jgi:hypothetical protein
MKKRTHPPIATGKLAVPAGAVHTPHASTYFTQKEVLNKLRELHKDAPLPYRFGVFSEPFRLTITRPGCEHDGALNKDPKAELERCNEHGATSGYGDVKALETKVNAYIRDAREILASEFSVKREFLDPIRETWAKTFIPADVPVKPYRIHIYGPFGHFRSHRDTLEEGLVGTFLVGLGGTAAWYEEGKF